MKRLLNTKLAGVAIAGVLVIAGEARAAIATYTATYGPATTEWSHNFVLPQFNPAFGTLQSLSITATESIDLNGTVQNLSTSPQNFTFRAGSLLTVTLPGALGFLQPSSLAAAQAYNLPGAEIAPYGPLSASDTVSYSYTLPADMAWFVGGGTVTLPGFTQTQELIAGGGGNILAVLNSTAAATLEVQYTYAPVVPEPSTFIAGALLLLPLGTMVLRAGRKS